MNNNRMIAEAVTRKLAEVICLRDPTLADHLRGTAEVACAVGAQMGADLDTLDLLYAAGLLHDIGKLAVSEAILWNPSRMEGDACSPRSGASPDRRRDGPRGRLGRALPPRANGR
jgi:response regulator RpfG family c-di-GMP phosphodiesterase